MEINVLELMNRARTYVSNSDYENAEALINLCLLDPELDGTNKIQSLGIKSHINFKKDIEAIVVQIARKFIKHINLVKDSDVAISFARGIYRAANILQKKNIFLSAYFYYRARLFIQHTIQGNEMLLNQVETEFASVQDAIVLQLGAMKIKMIDDIQIKSYLKQALSSQTILGDKCFLVSSTWLKSVVHFLNTDFSDKQFDKRNVCLLRFNTDNEEYLGTYPGPINNMGIIRHKDTWFDPTKGEEYTNIVLKEDLKENEDFTYLNEEVYSQVKQIFWVDYEVERRKVTSQENALCEIHLKQTKVLVLSSLLQDTGNMSYIRPRCIQMSKDATVSDLLKKIYVCLCHVIKTNKISYDMLKFQIISPEFNSQNRKFELFSVISAYNNKFANLNKKINGREINDLTQNLESLKLTKKDILVIEILTEKDLRKNWFISLTQDKTMTCCQCSLAINTNIIKCNSCADYLYCSIECKNSDETHIAYHKNLSTLYKKKVGIEDIIKINIRDLLPMKAKGGLTGLKNLGNTCFMNSAVQCLSNCEELTKYFLLKMFQVEINTKNKYGSGGCLAKAYYELVNELWLGDASFLSPWDFRQIFVSFVKQFAGFSQHDSHEMLSFMLDAFHEDLNRVKNKPYVELKEKMTNESEEGASERWWKNHLSRDNSIIVDLFHGQYKSVITCPKCKRVSITYDPLMYLGLPIGNGQLRLPVKLFTATKGNFNVEIILNEMTTFKEVKDQISKHVTNPVEGILTKDKMYKKRLLDNNTILEYNEKGYEIILNELEHNKPQNELTLLFINPVVFSRSFFGEVNPNNIFYPKVFSFKLNQTVKDLNFTLSNYYKRLLNPTLSEKYHIRIVNNIPDANPCEFCKKSCSHCLFDFQPDANLSDIKAMQRGNRNLILYFEVLGYSGKDKLFDEEFLNKTKDINAKRDSVNLYDCLNMFRKEEKLEKDNTWYCSVCKEHQEANKKMEIYKSPNILIVQLKRFKISTTNMFMGMFQNKKNETLVEFPIQNLDLRDFVVNEEEKEDAVYDLFAISQHYGSLSGGHYTALCLNNNKWYDYDDERVTRISESNIVTNAAYLLFYRKKSLSNN